MKISGQTNIVGIFGFPIKHTLSPVMHNTAFDFLKLNFRYIPYEVRPRNLKSAVESIRALNIRGVNITIPHKESVLQYLDKVDSLAKKIGSVNTIVNNNGKLTGYNTDGEGFLKDLSSNGFRIQGKRVLLLGAGGAGRAIAVYLSSAKAKKIYIVDAIEKRAHNLANKIHNGIFVDFKRRADYTNDIDIIINATPIGMHKEDPSPVPLKGITPGVFIYDVVYNRKTELIKHAEKLKARSLSGLGMLLYQGALAFELWTNKKAPVQIMRKSLLKTLKGGE